jgi:hypothetical protein
MNTNVIDSINDVIQEASMNVCDAMIGYIDKVESVKQWSKDDYLPNVVMESMNYFVEYASKDKDEITKWMDSKGYWYDGDNPNKKKKCMRMYHFLKQHDFRPSDETCASDMVDAHGDMKRFKIKFDTDGTGLKLTPDEETLFKFVVKNTKPDKNGKKKLFGDFDETERIIGKFCNKYPDIDTSSVIITMMTKLQLHQQMMTGNNSFYDPENNELDISSAILKGKQQLAQFLTKHEEGHANDLTSKGGTTPERRKEVIDTKREAGIDTYKNENRGLFQNVHDRQSIEKYADAYAAKHAQMRNKNAGKKNAKKTRNMNINDMHKAFTKLDKVVSSAAAAIDIDGCVEAMQSNINYIDEYLKTGKSDNVSISSLSSLQAFTELRSAIIKSMNFIESHPELIDTSDESKTLQNVGSVIEQYPEIDINAAEVLTKHIEQLCSMGGSIDKLRKTSENESNEYMNRLMSAVEDNEKKNKQLGLMKASSMLSWGPNVIIKKADVDKIFSKHNMGKTESDVRAIQSELSDLIKKKLTTLRGKFVSMIDTIKKEYKSMKQFSDLSTNLLYKFASKYIKEYFEEIM